MLYYDNYLQTLSQDPRRRLKNDLEARIKSQWYASHLWAEIQEQDCIGSKCFHPIEVWKNTVSEFTSNIIKDEKDFRRLMFDDVDKKCERGTYYFFDDNYWIVYEGIQSESVYPEVLVRRCNNIAKWIDVDTGTLVEMPCVLEYDITSTTPKIDKDSIVANSSTTLVFQGNQWTHKLKRNQRFIFNGIPYKFVAINNYLQNSYVTKDVTILYIDVDFDAEKPTDNVEDNIADFYEHNFSVVIHEDPQTQKAGTLGQLSATILYNGDEVVDRKVSWSGNEFVKINQDGYYELIGEAGDIATIYATFGDYYDCVNIEIVDRTVHEYEIVISPMVFELYEQETVRFSVYLCKDGVAQIDDIGIHVTGAVNDEYYLLDQDGHEFCLTNYHYSKEPLKINFITPKAEKQLTIKLKSLF